MTRMVIAGKLLLTPISPTQTNFGIKLIEAPALRPGLFQFMDAKSESLDTAKSTISEPQNDSELDMTAWWRRRRVGCSLMQKPLVVRLRLRRYARPIDAARIGASGHRSLWWCLPRRQCHTVGYAAQHRDPAKRCGYTYVLRNDHWCAWHLL